MNLFTKQKRTSKHENKLMVAKMLISGGIKQELEMNASTTSKLDINTVPAQSTLLSILWQPT